MVSVLDESVAEKIISSKNPDAAGRIVDPKLDSAYVRSLFSLHFGKTRPERSIS
jgi:hypothetical protein